MESESDDGRKEIFMKKEYKLYLDAVERQRDRMEQAFSYIWKHPEVGYKEVKTSRYLEEQFKELGYHVVRAEGITGFIADLETGRPGPKVAILGEMDALFCRTHPEADKNTGAVHACGHVIQTVSMLGVAAALKEVVDKKELSGSVRFVAVPAEETIDLEFRDSLIAEGKIKSVAGKIEFLYRGLFDEVDMAIMFHADSDEKKLFKLIDGMDGCITKHIEYYGVAAHAGGAPHKGINALYAANLGMSACNALRETFQEKDYVRYHPIITNGGGAANCIPDVVKMDTYVRAATQKKMMEINKKINRALGASAAAMGAKVSIEDEPGNMPMHSDANLNHLCKKVIEELFGEDVILYAGWDTQSSDIGDLSTVIPAIQPLCMGATGMQHGKDYQIADHEKCIMNPARVMICMLYELLRKEAKLAKKVVEEYEPLYKSKEEYFQVLEKIRCKKALVTYEENGEVHLNV